MFIGIGVGLLGGYLRSLYNNILIDSEISKMMKPIKYTDLVVLKCRIFKYDKGSNTHDNASAYFSDIMYHT